MALITIQCPACLQKYRIDESFSGRPVTCTAAKCGRSFTAPAAPQRALPEIEFSEAGNDLEGNADRLSHEREVVASKVTDSQTVSITEERLQEILNPSKDPRSSGPPPIPTRSGSSGDKFTQKQASPTNQNGSDLQTDYAHGSTPENHERISPVASEQSKNQFTSLHATFLIVILAVTLGFQFLSFGVQLLSFAKSTLTTTTWEYMIESPDDSGFTTKLNRLGKDGWEIVAARRATSRVGGGDASYEIILKRPAR